MVALVVGGLDELTEPGQPAAHTRRPGLGAMALGRAPPRRTVPRPPAPGRGWPLAAWITTRGSQGGLPDAQACRVWPPAPRAARRGQRWVLGAGGAHATTGQEPWRRNRHAQRDACGPAPAVTPAALGEPRPPASASAFGLPGGHRRAGQGFVAPVAPGPEVDQGPAARPESRVMLAQQAMAWGAMGPRGTSDAPLTWRLTGEGAVAGEAGPRPTQAEGAHLAPAERGLWPRVNRWWSGGLAELIKPHVEGREEGSRVDHGAAPLRDRDWRGTLVRGCLPLKFPLGNSHQAF
jgi:hypothetical protein